MSVLYWLAESSSPSTAPGQLLVPGAFGLKRGLLWALDSGRQVLRPWFCWRL
jgi:hypothetical protein